jgi:hypothetical protein
MYMEILATVCSAAGYKKDKAELFGTTQISRDAPDIRPAG